MNEYENILEKMMYDEFVMKNGNTLPIRESALDDINKLFNYDESKTIDMFNVIDNYLNTINNRIVELNNIISQANVENVYMFPREKEELKDLNEKLEFLKDIKLRYFNNLISEINRISGLADLDIKDDNKITQFAIYDSRDKIINMLVCLSNDDRFNKVKEFLELRNRIENIQAVPVKEEAINRLELLRNEIVASGIKIPKKLDVDFDLLKKLRNERAGIVKDNSTQNNPGGNPDDSDMFDDYMKNQEEMYNRDSVKTSFGEVPEFTKEAFKQFDDMFEEKPKEKPEEERPEEKKPEEKQDNFDMFDDYMKNQEEMYNRDPVKTSFGEVPEFTKEAFKQFDDMFDAKPEEKPEEKPKEENDAIDKHPEIKLNFRHLDEMEESNHSRKNSYEVFSNQVVAGMKDPNAGNAMLFGIDNFISGKEKKQDKEPGRISTMLNNASNVVREKINNNFTIKKVSNVVTKIKDVPSHLKDKVKEKKPSSKNINVLKRAKNFVVDKNSERKNRNRDDAVFKYNALVELSRSGQLSERYNNNPDYYDKLFKELSKYVSEDTYSIEDLNELLNSISDEKGRGK